MDRRVGVKSKSNPSLPSIDSIDLTSARQVEHALFNAKRYREHLDEEMRSMPARIEKADHVLDQLNEALYSIQEQNVESPSTTKLSFDYMEASLMHIEDYMTHNKDAFIVKALWFYWLVERNLIRKKLKYPMTNVSRKSFDRFNDKDRLIFKQFLLEDIYFGQRHGVSVSSLYYRLLWLNDTIEV